MVLTFYKFGLLHQIEDIRQALFVGFFGPIGVSAMFYLYISREFLREIHVNDVPRNDGQILAEITEVVVWFLIICSIVVHGLSVPLGKLGFYLPRTISTAISTERISATQSMTRSNEADEPQPLGLREHLPHVRPPGVALHRRMTTSERGDAVSSTGSGGMLIPRSIARTAKHIWADIQRPHGATVHGANDGVRGKGTAQKDSSPSGSSGNSKGKRMEISGPTNARVIGHAINEPHADSTDADNMLRDLDGEPERPPAVSAATSRVQSPERSGTSTPPNRQLRAITFADERTGQRGEDKGAVELAGVSERST